MNRDTVKTLAGLVVIGVIVVATFLYGNAQRQNQLKHDASVSKSQANAGASASPAVAASAAPAPKTPAASGKVATNTAPVQSPTSSNLQGGSATASGTPKPTSTPAPSATPTKTPAATPTQVAAAPSTVPQTGGSTPLPQTGPAQELAGVIGLAAIVTMWLWLRRSQRAIFTAARNNR